jgi:polysaccharide deacetylase family protein (PEP-CTERM system associated)
MNHVLTFDVEEYFHVTAFADSVSSSDWSSMKSRLEPTVELTLELLHDSGNTATFFILGWVAEHYPGLVRRVAEAGHEVACHSNAHQQVFRLTRTQFRDDSQRAKDLLEQAGGIAVEGYRAPSFSIVRESMWGLEVLAELGFRYDSSIFPVRHPNYGIDTAPLDPFLVETAAGPMVEFPMPALQVGSRRAPFGGGAYLRLLPYWYTKWAIERYSAETENPAIIYAHPWELDPQQQRMNGRLTSRLRHYIGLRGVEKKMRQLLTDFRFVTLGSMLDRVRNASETTHVSAVAVG